jgi:RsiW-degrading membrane proteinase PrsW (M82 family)
MKKGDSMRGLRESRLLGIVLIVLGVVVYLMMWGMIPLLWPYRDHPLMWVLLAFLSGGHLEELLYETGSFL